MRHFNKKNRLTFTSFEKAKNELGHQLSELEHFGAYNALCVKDIYPNLMSTEVICQDMKEFGRDIPTFGLGVTFLRMAETLSFEMLKIKVLKDAYTFVGDGYYIRIVRSNNKYPTYCYCMALKLLDSDEEVEIVFPAKSQESVKRIQKRIHFTMGKKTLRSFVDEMLDTNFNKFVHQFENDDKVKTIVQMHDIMTKAYVNAMKK